MLGFLYFHNDPHYQNCQVHFRLLLQSHVILHFHTVAPSVILDCQRLPCHFFQVHVQNLLFHILVHCLSVSDQMLHHCLFLNDSDHFVFVGVLMNVQNCDCGVCLMHYRSDRDLAYGTVVVSAYLH